MKYAFIFRIAIAILSILLASQISVTLPISQQGIPFTAQSLIIFIIAGLTRPPYFMTICIGYLSLGILGLPVFADGSSGWEKIEGSSGGFLYGFLFAGTCISMMIQTGKSFSFSKSILIMLIGTMVLFLFGLSHLAYKFGWTKALEYGLFPFWVMALVKAGFAAVVVWWARKRYGGLL